MPAALDSLDDAAELMRCPREESWGEAVALLGDAAELDALRERTSDAHHCAWLRESAWACAELPESAGEMAGGPCPHSAHHDPRKAERLGIATGSADLVERAYWIGDAAMLGAMEPETSTAEEWAVARYMRRRIVADDYQLLAAKIAELIARMMGGGAG